ncbi:hypothetical protein Vsou_00370 [Vulcanisaeta souniana JCM 11219]|uniref:Uncharacterized protein n=1 Tax=Vulcanisaeta souniana JCM 11219 TaxID=1293586 RepID=A0ABN6SM36_9CREN|nr:hypothetical protein Vsou_00370 [Vulcanisaeta souniana JCM 11219]
MDIGSFMYVMTGNYSFLINTYLSYFDILRKIYLM